MRRTVELVDRARIAIDNLQQRDQEKVVATIEILENYPEDPRLQRKVYKIKKLQDYYVAQAGMKYRIIFTLSDDQITIVDIVHHDRLERLFGSGLEGKP